MREGRWITIVLTVGVGLLLGLNSGWVLADDQKEKKAGDVQERGLPGGITGNFGGLVKTAKPPAMAVDLFPVQIPGVNCLRNESGLLITIGNMGSVGAPATILRVQFPNGIVNVNIPPIGPSSLVQAPPVPIPSGCFSPDCGFLIRVDAGGAVTEVGGPYPQGAEQNNTASGYCIG
jgi:hypothetical protein